MAHTSSDPSTSRSMNNLRKAIEIASRSVRITIVIGIITLLISFSGMEGLYAMLPHSPGIPANVRHVTCLLIAAVITYYSVWPPLRNAHYNLADLRLELQVRTSVEHKARGNAWSQVSAETRREAVKMIALVMAAARRSGRAIVIADQIQQIKTHCQDPKVIEMIAESKSVDEVIEIISKPKNVDEAR